MNNTPNTDEELDNFSYKELSKKVFLVFSALLMIALATSWYLEVELLDNAEVEFTAEDVVQLDDSQSILQLITPFSCVSSSDFIENNFCEELYHDNYYGEGWVTSDEICYKEYVTFDFKKSIYLEFMVIQNFEIDNLFQQYDKVKELNIIYSNNRVEPQLFQMENNNISQWIDLNQETTSVSLEIKSSYKDPENSQCGIASVSFYGREQG